MCLSREINIKMCRIYTKIHKNAILYKSCNKDHLQRIRNQSENDDIPQEPENLSFALIIIVFFYFAFLKDIILIILFQIVRIVRIASPELRLSLSRDFRLLHPMPPFIFSLQSLLLKPKRNQVFATNSNFLIHIYLQPNPVNLR